MAKITPLSDLANLTNEQTAVTTINTNNQRVEDALENTVSRDGSSPNQMAADFDMNGNSILNLPEPTGPTEPVRKQEFDEALDELDNLTAAVTAAEEAQEGAEEAEDGALEAQADIMAILNGLTVMYVGSGVPSAGLGENGDVYLDSGHARYAVYGPKAAGAWGSIVGYLIGLDGSMSGPVSSVADNIATFFDTSGQTVKDSGVAITSLAPKASPTFTGVPAAPTASTATNTTQIATTAFVKQEIDVVKGGVSTSFDTLSEIATDLGLKNVKSANLSDVANAATAFGNIKQNATDSATGVVELAIASEVVTGTDAARAITPAALNGAQIFGNAPVNSQSTAYTAVAADANKTLLHPIADTNNRTFTIPANGSVPYPLGTMITFVNEVNTLTIAITTDTLMLAGAGTTGSRTLAANGMATAVKITTTKWMISGAGLT